MAIVCPQSHEIEVRLSRSRALYKLTFKDIVADDWNPNRPVDSHLFRSEAGGETPEERKTARSGSIREEIVDASLECA